MTQSSGDFEVLVDIPGLTLVRVDGGMRFDVVPGFRTRQEAIAILSEFGDVNWPDENEGADGGSVAASS
ncbi:hypothetical protein SAMN04487916_11751 [Arthrobacter sp. ov407]|uniref:hypothetical protein n=1 Tax=Arthrobacter sp. ov407 TaxID=1761748 RepID=UPI00087FA5A5|nr:hypothetical protein [Arthrobacter sp. ov407]SDL90217.1 hypothetical protein SAMN04487916_11751 [Arthrobacter sp. ov407]